MQATPWTRLGTNVSLGWHTPPGRSQSIAASLIPTGVWCDSVRNQQSEKTGAVRVCRNEGGPRCCKVLTVLAYIRSNKQCRITSRHAVRDRVQSDHRED